MEKEQVNFHPLTFFALAISQLPGYLIENCFIAYEHDILIDWCTDFAKFVYEQTDKVLVYKDIVLDGDDTVEKYILEAEKLLTHLDKFDDNSPFCYTEETRKLLKENLPKIIDKYYELFKAYSLYNIEKDSTKDLYSEDILSKLEYDTKNLDVYEKYQEQT